MLYGLLSFLLFHGFCFVFIQSRTANITVTSSDVHISHLRNLMNTFKTASRCSTSNYTINIVPYNFTAPFVSPIGKNNFSNIQLVFGPQQYFSPQYYGFQNGTSQLNFPNAYITDIFMDNPLRLKLMMQAVNETIQNDVNKTVVFVLNGSITDPIQPWKRFNPILYLSTFKGSLSVQFYTNSGDEDKICNQIIQSKSVTIAMDLSREGTLAVLRACNDRNLLNWRYRWLVFFSSLSYLNGTSSLNLTLRENFTVYEFSQTRDFTVVDIIDDEQDVVLSDISYLILQIMDFSECQLQPVKNPISVRTGDFSFANGVVNRLTWRLDIYRPIGNLLSNVGNATITNGVISIRLPLTNSFNNSVANLLSEIKKKVFRIAAMVEVPFVYTEIVNGTVNQTGYCVEMIIYIMRILGVRYNLTFYDQPNGGLSGKQIFNGMLGIIQNRQADIAIGPITENSLYKPYLYFTKPFYTYNVAVIYRVPPANIFNQIFEFIDAFTWHVWALVISSCIIYAIALTLVNMISPNQANFGFLYSLLFSMGSMVQGVTTALPDKISGRILVVFWWIFNIAVLLAYVANYAAVRTNIRLQTTITQLGDLILQSQYSYATVEESAIDSYLVASASSDIQTLNQHINTQYLKLMSKNMEDGMKLVRNTTFAFIYSDASLKHYLNESCMFLTSGGDSFNYSFILPLHNDYFNIINDQMEKIDPNFTEYLKKKYFPTIITPRCRSDTFLDAILEILDYIFLPSINFSLRMNQFAGIFVIMLLGIIISLFMALIEFIVRKCKKKNPRTRLE